MRTKKINKVLLIFPPVIFSYESPKQIMPPLGISYLGAFLSPDYEVKLLDAALEGYENENKIAPGFLSYGLADRAIERKIKEYSPDLVGVSCLYSSQFSKVAEICSMVKGLSASIITVIGGSHPTFFAKECLLACTDIDFIVQGEGELGLKELLDVLNAGKSYEFIDGLAFRKNGSLQINAKKKLIENLDDLSFPARELLPLDKYFRINLPMGLVNRRNPSINMITSRGCIFKCSFCSSCRFWGSRFRARSVENVLTEMEHLREKFNIKELKFFDDNLTLDPVRAKKIFRGMIEKRFDFTWNTPNGVDISTLDQEMLKLMKKSGCYEVTLAVESGDEHTLGQVIKKQFDLKKVEQVVKWIKAEGLDTYGFFIIGFPQETKKQINNTLRFIEKIKLDRISLFIANPLPGTQIYEYCKENGYISPEQMSLHLDYFHSQFKTVEFDQKYLERLRRRWYWTYNLKLFFRNPFKFFEKYYIFLIRKPVFLIKMLLRKMLVPVLKR